MADVLLKENYHVYWNASDCDTIIMGLTDGGLLETLLGFNIDVDFSTGEAIQVDIDVPLAGDDYVYGLDVDLQQTAAYGAGGWATSGGMIGVRSDVHVDYRITEAYAGYFNVYIDPAATCTLNDMLGVFGRITIVGPVTQGAATSQIAALRGSISNGSSGSYDGQVFALSLDYGSNVNYGDTTALIYMWTHGDARCDYGFFLNNYSPNMVAGILLAETAGATPLMTTGISITAATTTAISIANTSVGNSISIDRDMDFNAMAGDYPAGLYIDLDQSTTYGSTWNLFGGFYGVNARLHVDGGNTGAYCIFGRAYVESTGSGEKVNDVYGVMGELRLTGADIQRGASTSSMAGLRSSVSNLSTGAYDGQVYGLMIDYGSNVNYGDNTGLIFAYTHADARCDYGIYILNYSPYMTTGLLLTEQNTSASMKVGIDVDVNAIGADVNYYGMDLDLTQRAISGGGYLSRGNLTGIRSDCAATGNIDHAWAVRAGSSIAMAANSETNQFYGGLFNASASGAFTLTLHDGLVGAQLNISVASNVVDITGGLIAAAFIFPNVETPVTSIVYGAYIKCTNYCDFGTSVQVESNNITAAMRIQTTDSAVLPIGLQLNSPSGSITKQIEFTSGVGIYTGSADPNGSLSAEDGSIYLRTGTTTATTIIYVCTGTTNWSATTV